MSESPFLYMKQNTKTVLWNDSADPKELKDALTWGIVGATCNPVIALSALKADKEYWNGRIKEFAKLNPSSISESPRTSRARSEVRRVTALLNSVSA